MPGTRVPRNTRWCWHDLVAEYGEDMALEMLQHMPGLGQFVDDAHVTTVAGADRVQSHHQIAPGGWIPHVRSLSVKGKRVWDPRPVHPANLKGPDGDVGPRDNL